ncbi:dihydrofolate reductase, partial [Arthrospira platensis SPKY1]|nr:dihydrofolate reductase [Arthrospira platensis SPKY1]
MSSGNHPGKPKLSAIVAMANNRVIGANGTLPWHLPEDLKFFKKTTLGGVLVMGRKTYDSIGRPLPGRETIVVSRSATAIAGVKVVNDPHAVLELDTDKPIWIVGGAEIYRQLLPYCSELFITRVNLEVEGDAFFPQFESDFKRIATIDQNETF